MSSPDKRQARLRAFSQQALARLQTTRSELENRRGHPPRLGDVFALAATAGLAVLWVVVARHRQNAERLLVLAADMTPLAGSADVAIGAGAPCGALTLRCGVGVWLGPQVLESAVRASVLAPGDLARARRRVEAIASGRIIAGSAQSGMEATSGYRALLHRARAARRTLATVAEIGPADGQLLRFPEDGDVAMW